MFKKLAGVVSAFALVTVLGVFGANAVSAQTTTPPTQGAPAQSAPAQQGQTQQLPGPRGFGDFGCFGMGGGNFTAFDAAAQALNLTPTQLFEQLHSGKTLSDIATAQNVDLAKVQDAVKAAQTQAEQDRINQAVKDGTITQAQADWMLQGLKNGWMGGPGFGRGGHGHGGPGFGPNGAAPGTNGTAPAAPAAPSTSTPG